MREEIERRRSAIESYRRRHHIERLKQFGHEKQLAQKHGRLEEYIDFVFAHRMVHVPLIAQQGRLGKGADDLVTISLHTTDDEFLVGASGFAMTSALHAHRACTQMFNWSETSIEDVQNDH